MRRLTAVLLATLAFPAAASATTGGARYGEPVASPAPEPVTAPVAAPPVTPVVAPVAGQVATINPDGTATPPAGAPATVVAVFRAANRIATLPYRYGGGHGSFTDTAYDCSGSLSYALHGAGLLDSTLASRGLATWGRSGAGRWISVYANDDHTFMVIAGVRFDTSGQRPAGTRWQPAQRSLAGFTVRHPPRL